MPIEDDIKFRQQIFDIGNQISALLAGTNTQQSLIAIGLHIYGISRHKNVSIYEYISIIENSAESFSEFYKDKLYKISNDQN